MGNDRTQGLLGQALDALMAAGYEDEAQAVRELESRLREAEAENARLHEMNRELTDSHNFYLVASSKAEARAERLEAELREAREALAFYADEENHTIQIRFAPVTDERYGGPSRVAEDRGDRARGVLEKDTEDAE